MSQFVDYLAEKKGKAISALQKWLSLSFSQYIGPPVEKWGFIICQKWLCL